MSGGKRTPRSRVGFGRLNKVSKQNEIAEISSPTFATLGRTIRSMGRLRVYSERGKQLRAIQQHRSPFAVRIKILPKVLLDS